jgi:hypothetical protein
MVYRIFCHRLLVLHGCMVVSKMTLATDAYCFLFYFPFIHHTVCKQSYIFQNPISQLGSNKTGSVLLKRTVNLFRTARGTIQLETLPYYKS